MVNFKIYEPHPTTTQNAYIHSGRGGVGNHFKAPATSPPSLAHGPASLFTHGLPSSTSTTKFSSGRGGAGNILSAKEKVVYDFDEEIKRQTTKTKAEGVCHIGRGGAGNWEKRRESGSSSERGSSEGRRSGLFGRLSGSFDWR